MHYQFIIGGCYYQIIFGQFFRIHLTETIRAATLRRLDEMMEVDVVHYIDYVERQLAASGLAYGQVPMAQSASELWTVFFQFKTLRNIVDAFD